MLLPERSHVARICGQSALDDNGGVTAACFVPHSGTDERPADRYLSVHWLEYFGLVDISVCLAALRNYLMNSPVPGERKPTRNGKLAVLRCDEVVARALNDVGVQINFSHEPRACLGTVAPGVVVLEDGSIRVGVDAARAEAEGCALDPHSGLYTLPAEAAHELAVQQLLASLVFHVEAGRLA